MLLEAVHISKTYGREVVLKDVSVGVRSGESLAVTGLSGSGKSTLLAILGLLLEPAEGEVLFQKRKIAGLSDHEKSRLRNCHFGFIFQNPQLIGSLSVLDNVLVPARLARKGNLQQRAEQLLKDLGLGNRLRHLPYQLSIGQKRRAAIARALLLDPVLVLADEPTNDLDPGSAAVVGDFLFALPGNNKALVLVTHDAPLAGKADRAVQILEGRLADLPAAGRD